MRVFVNLPWEHPARELIRTEAAKTVHEHYSWQEAASVPMDLSIDHILLATNNLVAWYLDHIDDYTLEEVAVMHDVLVRDALERRKLYVVREDWRADAPESTLNRATSFSASGFLWRLL